MENSKKIRIIFIIAVFVFLSVITMYQQHSSTIQQSVFKDLSLSKNQLNLHLNRVEFVSDGEKTYDVKILNQDEVSKYLKVLGNMKVKKQLYCPKTIHYNGSADTLYIYGENQTVDMQIFDTGEMRVWQRDNKVCLYIFDSEEEFEDLRDLHSQLFNKYNTKD